MTHPAETPLLEALSALVEKWEKRAEDWREIHAKGTNPQAKGRAGELGTCALEARQLLDPPE